MVNWIAYENFLATKFKAKKKILLLVFAAIACTVLISGAVALTWYYSRNQDSTVVAGITVTVSDIPQTVEQNKAFTITGQLAGGSASFNGVLVHLFVNGVDVATAPADSTGHYSFTYTPTQPINAGISFHTGITI